MQHTLEIRPVLSSDLPALKAIIDSTELFPSHLLDDMISDFLHNPSSADIWLTAGWNNLPQAIVYCAPEKLTEGTYNLYLIAVSKEMQGQGVGSALTRHLETRLQAQGHRVLIVETSGLPEFESTRQFYQRLGYTHEATIRDFYKEHDDKIVFWKKLH